MNELSPKKLEALRKAREAAEKLKIKCDICNKEFVKGGFKNHREFCIKKMNKRKLCPVCNKEFFTDGVTCSYGCSNTYFRTGKNHPNWKDDSYRSTCFLYHKKECIVCGENKIVEVHHLDENKNNNSPENLVPLCPTHHQYYHSKYRNEVIDQITNYIRIFNVDNDNTV